MQSGQVFDIKNLFVPGGRAVRQWFGRKHAMADVFSKKKRSQIMAAVKSTGNKVTEKRLAAIFRRNHVTGWRRHVSLLGKPDFTFAAQRLFVFVDGCFWHGCPSHLRMPISNQKYWLQKIARNRARDRSTRRALRLKGWHVLRVWEHDLRNELRVVRRIENALGQNKQTVRGKTRPH